MVTEATPVRHFPSLEEINALADPADFSDVLHLNLLTIRDIEKASKGIALRLLDEQNIINFGRYPVELLLDQIVPSDSRELAPLVFARHDHNSASYSDQDLLLSIYNQLHQKHQLKIVEVEPAEYSDLPWVDNEKTWIRQGRVFKRRIRQIIPKGTHARFGMVSVHGEGSLFIYGPGSNHLDYIPFLADENDEHLGFDCFGDDSVVVLCSCRTGFFDPKEWQHSVARNLSVITHATFVGPDDDCNMKELTISDNGKKLTCCPTYKDTKGKPVRANAYKDGKQVEVYLN